MIVLSEGRIIKFFRVSHQVVHLYIFLTRFENENQQKFGWKLEKKK